MINCKWTDKEIIGELKESKIKCNRTYICGAGKSKSKIEFAILNQKIEIQNRASILLRKSIVNMGKNFELVFLVYKYDPDISF